MDWLYMGTTSPVYLEKQNASMMAKALDLRKDIVTADITNSLRAGTSCLRAAIDAVKAGSAKHCLVAVSECQGAPPNSAFERLFGDGAAALMIGDKDVAVEIEGSYGITSDFLDIWRNPRDRYPQMWEERFVVEHGYLERIPEVVSGLCKKYSVTPKVFNKVVYYGYDARRHAEISKMLRLEPGQIQDPLLNSVGNTRAASAFMMLVAALEDAKPGDRILFISYGDGADAFMLKVTDKIADIKGRRGIKKHLESKMMMPFYGKYLRFRDMMEWEKNRIARAYGSLTMAWRDREWVFACKGQKCKNCGQIEFPQQRICAYCQAKDNFEDINLSEKKGTLFTYSMDSLTTVTPDPPNVLAVVDLEGGGRFYTTMTDRDTGNLTMGMPMELTFRKVHDEQRYHNWRSCKKVAPWY
ncbi:MAG: OB-fold domain-containing protein [Dehalococcoidia bacterium]|nr:OB-fold domain-containing protein [Dehalococcoidia bacterium]